MYWQTFFQTLPWIVLKYNIERNILSVQRFAITVTTTTKKSTSLSTVAITTTTTSPTVVTTTSTKLLTSRLSNVSRTQKSTTKGTGKYNLLFKNELLND